MFKGSVKYYIIYLLILVIGTVGFIGGFYYVSAQTLTNALEDAGIIQNDNPFEEDSSFNLFDMNKAKEKLESWE